MLIVFLATCLPARRRRGIQQNPPLREHGCDASTSAWEQTSAEPFAPSVSKHR